MTANITQIGDAIQNLSLNFTQINTTDILTTAIQHNNTNSNGWVGIFIVSIMCMSVAIYLWRFRNDFNMFDMLNLNMANLVIFLDIMICLTIWQIIESYQVFIWFYTFYFVLCAVSLLKKDMQNTET
jgi:hypothetical protein